MEIMAIDGLSAHCAARGVEREVNLFLLQDASLTTGDFVMVHVGYAIQKIAADHARSAWELYDEMLSTSEATLPEETPHA